jgi:competence protein ComGC
MIRTFVNGTTLGVALFASSALMAGEPSCPMHAQHMAEKKQHVTADGSAHHGKEVDQRHDTFGMSHDTSTHSFRLFADGGAIELRSNRTDDEKTITAIRTHLQQIVEEFNRADFSTPGFVHGYSPAGVEEMQRLRGAIAYRYQSLPAGGRIRITTRTAEAIAAIHDFLRFQVTEHRTADSGKIEEEKTPATR